MPLQMSHEWVAVATFPPFSVSCTLFHSLAYTCTAKNEQINKINAMKSCTVQSTLWKWSFCGSDSGSKVWTYPLQDVSFLYAYWVGYIALICVILINPNLTPNCAGLFLGFLAWRYKLHLPKCFANLHNVKNSKMNFWNTDSINTKLKKVLKGIFIL